MLRSYRPLVAFWIVIGGLLAAGALVLQLLGPRTLASRADAPLTAHVGSAASPARLPLSTLHPAPVLAASGTPIPDPDPALLEPASAVPDAMLPRRQGSRTSAMLYAAAFDPAERHPRVALVLDGAGLDEAMTRSAMAGLPSVIDLAFSAYTPPARAAVLAGEARRQGRECLLSIPMEPSGYPSVEEGSRALLAGATPEQNVRNLQWALSRVAGCVGATGASDGMEGERFVQSPQEYAGLLQELDERGLIYLDPRSGTAIPDEAVPASRRQPYRVDVVVDRPPAPGEPADAAAIDRHLAELSDAALHQGSAIGLAGPPTPVLLDRIMVWAHGLAARGLVLAPLTALTPPSATSRATMQ